MKGIRYTNLKLHADVFDVFSENIIDISKRIDLDISKKEKRK